MIRKAQVRPVPPVLPQQESEDGKAENLGTFTTRAAAVQHEREVQFFKRRG